jgi:hypothetical protein
MNEREAPPEPLESREQGAAPRARRRLFVRLSAIGSSAQAAIPGLYAWAITVAPAAWSRGAPILAKAASIAGVLALVTAPLVENASPAPREDGVQADARGLAAWRTWTGPTWARIWSVWGFVLSSAIVWALVPGALSSVKLDAVRGALGIVGWALFAFASAGPALRPDPGSVGRIVAGSALKPRSELPRGDGAYVAVGILLALGMQGVGWGITVPERAVLVRLITVACGIAVVGATTSIALARHAARTPASTRLRIRRALPWVVMLLVFVASGAALTLAR